MVVLCVLLVACLPSFHPLISCDPYVHYARPASQKDKKSQCDNNKTVKKSSLLLFQCSCANFLDVL